ncbi:2TM domain-containing protein [Pseudolysinimonas sp.]|uniref:2TM domain-containing protein n=1 Tax=Pseudolysinimonas sp. TaxID=2680009 RepID=UPI003F7D5F86
MSEPDIREVARKRIKARRDFWYMILVFVIILALCSAVWALTGMGYFWPMWLIFGFGIATLFSALSTFGPGSRPISQQRIDDEVRKLGGGPGA